jgi:hypothetical protein
MTAFGCGFNRSTQLPKSRHPNNCFGEKQTLVLSGEFWDELQERKREVLAGSCRS